MTPAVTPDPLTVALRHSPAVRLLHRTQKDDDGWPVPGTVFARQPLVVYLASSLDLVSPTAAARAPRRAYDTPARILADWEIDQP